MNHFLGSSIVVVVVDMGESIPRNKFSQRSASFAQKQQQQQQWQSVTQLLSSTMFSPIFRICWCVSVSFMKESDGEGQDTRKEYKTQQTKTQKKRSLHTQASEALQPRPPHSTPSHWHSGVFPFFPPVSCLPFFSHATHIFPLLPPPSSLTHHRQWKSLGRADIFSVRR